MKRKHKIFLARRYAKMRGDQWLKTIDRVRRLIANATEMKKRVPSNAIFEVTAADDDLDILASTELTFSEYEAIRRWILKRRLHELRSYGVDI